jgi:hypothetical protein
MKMRRFAVALSLALGPCVTAAQEPPPDPPATGGGGRGERRHGSHRSGPSTG